MPERRGKDYTKMRIIKFRGKVEGNWWYVTPDDEPWEQFWSLVNRSTVGQYIGRADKHVKAIYEGDIVRGYRGDTWYSFQMENIIQGNSLLSSFESNHLEVMGNVYDNPELLTP